MPDLTDEEILAKWKWKFPRGRVEVDRIRDGWVYFSSKKKRARQWDLVRMPVATFLEAIRKELSC